MTLDTVCDVDKADLESIPGPVEIIESSSASCSGEYKEDKIKFDNPTIPDQTPTPLLRTWFDKNGDLSGFSVDTEIALETSDNDVTIKPGATGKPMGAPQSRSVTNSTPPSWRA